MRFGISTFSVSPDSIIDLTGEEYAQIATAKNALVTMIGVEQKFDLLLENYADYERELLDLSLHQVLHRDLPWRGSQKDIAAVTRRLANLLSAARLYVDQVKHDLHAVFGSKHHVNETLRAKLSEEYDRRLGYRAMEALRNIMQHRSLPIDRLSYASDGQPGGVRFRTAPEMEVARLREAGLKAAVLKELEGKGEFVSVTPLVREYVEGLACVHETLRTASATQIAEWDSTVASVHARAVACWGGEDSRAFLIVQLDDAGQVGQSIQLFIELTHYRCALEQRNGDLSDLAHRYVSGECAHDA